MISRRNFIMTLPIMASATMLPSLALAQGWEEVAPIIISAAEALGKKLLSPPNQDADIDSALGEINRKLDRITAFLENLPSLLQTSLEQQHIRDLQESIQSRRDSIMIEIGKYKTAKGSLRESLQTTLLVAANSTSSDLDGLMQHGGSTYPTVGFGILLTITIFKALKQSAMMKDLASVQLAKFDAACFDPASDTSLAAMLGKAQVSADKELADINRLPRSGTVGCYVQQTGHGEFEIDHDFFYGAKVIPQSGIPTSGPFVIQKNGQTDGSNWLPGVRRPNFCDFYDNSDINGPSTFYNDQLASYKGLNASVEAAQSYFNDAKSISRALKMAAGLPAQ